MDDKNGSNPAGSGGMEKTVKFLVGKGFYIVLFLCLAAIGISGYVILFSNNSSIDPDLGEIPDPTLGAELDFSGMSLAGTSETLAQSKESDRAAAAHTGMTEKVTTGKTAALTEPPPPETEPPHTEATEANVTEQAKIFYSAPVNGSVLNLFSGDVPVFNPTMGDWRVHAGVDFAAEVGTEVRAVAAGTVKKVYSDQFRGVCLEIGHYDGLTSVYCGLEDSISLAPGDRVDLGEVVGRVGETAEFELSQAPHLHFELRDEGAALDPLEYFSPKE